MGGYQGIFEHLEPQPDVATLAIAGRANLNGRPFDGFAADYAEKLVKWIGMPPKIIWCLHDEGALNPKFIDTKAATRVLTRRLPANFGTWGIIKFIKFLESRHSN